MLPRVDVSFNRELFNTRSTTSRLHFGEKKLCRSIRDRDGGGEGGGRVISISGGEQGYSAWHGYIVFRFAAVPSIFDATDKRNRRTLYDEDRPLFDVSCSDFVAPSRVITRHQKDFSLLAKSPCRNASSRVVEM